MKQTVLLILAFAVIVMSGCSKDETTAEATFNPDFSDGTDGLSSVHLNITSGNSYTVPSGKNFHGYIEGTNFLVFPITINGQEIEGYQWIRIILTDGDVISSTAVADRIFVSGYTSPQQTQVVYVDIAGGSYTVPLGKQFYLTWLNITPWSGASQQIYVDSVSIKWDWIVFERSTSAYLTIDEGSTVTTNATGGTKVFLNGFLK